MIVADTSALVSIASVDLLDTFLSEFDVHTTETVVEEPEETGAYDDRHGDAADTALDSLERVETHESRENSPPRASIGEKVAAHSSPRNERRSS